MFVKSVQTLLVIWLLGFSVDAVAQETGGEPEQETGAVVDIEAAIQSYVSAFNARDAEKLAGHWAPKGVYTSRSSGEQIVGREAMVAEFNSMFAGESVPNLAVMTESIDFISPSVALERGVATVTHSGDDVVETSYSVVYVNQDGVWLIDRVTEDEIVVAISNKEKLEPLEWMIGEWTTEGDGGDVELSCNWTANQNFITRKYKVTDESGEVTSSGLQIIGWDPVNNQIRSWLFDSDGSYVSGKWTQGDDRWVVQSVATLADGGTGSFTGIYQPTDEDSFVWQKANRVLDGELLPSLDEVVIRRK